MPRHVGDKTKKADAKQCGGRVWQQVAQTHGDATQGEDDAIKALMVAFKEGNFGKKDLDAALRAYQAAVDATKSPHRKAAEGCYT